MEYETLRRLDQNECDFALGRQYIELAAKGADMETTRLIAALKAYLQTGEADKQKAAFYDFLIELGSLTFLLYKWGLLLFYLKQNELGELLLTIAFEDKQAIIVEKEGGLTLEELHSEKPIFSAKHGKKSALFSLLLQLADKRAALDIVSVSQDAQRFDGNRISFNEERKAAQRDHTALIEAEFFRDKTRLDSLQKLFIDSFGRPSAMIAE
jgi:hypothetical protein